MITAQYYGHMQTVTHCKTEEYDAKTLRGLLRRIGERHGAEARSAARASHIMVNGESAGQRGGWGQKLPKGAVLQFLPVCGGG